MAVSHWWRQLNPDAQLWLVNNNGDDLPIPIAEQIVAAGGAAIAGAPLADADIDWIEAVANGESPD